VRSHFLWMLVYALLTSAFFGVLWREAKRDRLKLFLQIFACMIGGGLLLAWIMYPFPSAPPAPFP
jgi:hypothetical protein